MRFTLGLHRHTPERRRTYAAKNVPLPKRHAKTFPKSWQIRWLRKSEILAFHPQAGCPLQREFNRVSFWQSATLGQTGPFPADCSLPPSLPRLLGFLPHPRPSSRRRSDRGIPQTRSGAEPTLWGSPSNLTLPLAPPKKPFDPKGHETNQPTSTRLQSCYLHNVCHVSPPSPLQPKIPALFTPYSGRSPALRAPWAGSENP